MSASPVWEEMRPGLGGGLQMSQARQGLAPDRDVGTLVSITQRLRRRTVNRAATVNLPRTCAVVEIERRLWRLVVERLN